MDIAAKVVKDDGGALDVILYEHGHYSKPLCIIPYFRFKQMVESVKKDSNVQEQEYKEKTER